MADSPDFSEILRRTVQVNASLYKGWVDLSLDYWRRVGEIFGVPSAAGLESASSEMAEEEAAGAGMLVLEGDAGTTARGAFLVTNDLGRKIKCELVASQPSGARGAGQKARVTFDPPSLELAPGEQRVVHALVDVDDQLTAGAAYTGTVSIKGMDGFSVPFVLRRTHTVDDAVNGEPAAPSEPPASPSKDAPGGPRAAVGKQGRAQPAKQGRPKSARQKQPQSAKKGQRRARHKE